MFVNRLAIAVLYLTDGPVPLIEEVIEGDSIAGTLRELP
jgi:hypothetical protein